jgi:hypothetical protein
MTNADNHKVYNFWATMSNSGVCLQPNYTSCTQAYFYYTSDESAHQSGTGWQYHYNTSAVDPTGSYARAEIHVNLDIPWRPDPSSGAILTTGTAY